MVYSEELSQLIMDEIAKTQTETFIYAESKGYNMDDFITKYMNSDFCNREMDSLDSYYHFKNGTVCLSCLEHETEISKEPYDSYVDVGFVGKIYRYLVYALNIPSKDVIHLISPRELDSLAVEYELYNTSDIVKDIISRYHLSGTSQMFEQFYGKPFSKIGTEDLCSTEEINWGEDVGGEML